MTAIAGAYAAQHASAYAQVSAKGAPVSFTKGAVTVAGVAARVRGKALTYQSLNLVQSESPTLLFVPATYGELPPLGAFVTFGGAKYAARDIDPLAPDGKAISARIVVVR